MIRSKQSDQSVKTITRGKANRIGALYKIKKPPFWRLSLIKEKSFIFNKTLVKKINIQTYKHTKLLS